MSIFTTNRSFSKTQLPDGTIRQRSYSRSARELGLSVPSLQMPAKMREALQLTRETDPGSLSPEQMTVAGAHPTYARESAPDSTWSSAQTQPVRLAGTSSFNRMPPVSPANSKTDELIGLIEEDLIDKKKEGMQEHSRKTLIGMLAIALGSILIISFSTYDDFKNYSSRDRIPSFFDSFWVMNVLIGIALIAAALSTTKQIDKGGSYRTAKLALFIGTCACVVIACYNGFGNNNLQISFWFAVGAFVLQVCNSLMSGFKTMFSLLHLPLLLVSGFLIYIFWPGLNGQTAYSEDTHYDDDE